MKKLSETYKELGIAFKFPIEIKDTNGKRTYCEDSNGYWFKYEYDANGEATYYEDSYGYWYKREYDSNGNQTYHEDSDGYWFKYEYDSNGRVTYHEDSNGYWERFERDAKGRPTYSEDSNDFWQKWERDADGNMDYYEDSTGVKKGTPKSDKAFITLDREETILFADILKAAPTPPTPEFKRALQAYRDFIIGHI